MKLIAGVLLAAAAMASAPGASGATASRTLCIDDGGVLRWTDDGSEATLFGVNYYPPFSSDYKDIKTAGLDAHEVIRQDICHFRRLGFTCLRLHAFDQSISTFDGGLIDNEHLELLDYLVDEAAKAGLYTVLTPIAWWGPHKVADPQSFSARFTMPEMTSDPDALKCQTRFLAEFATHVNRYSGKSYAQDPAVAAFECINEPKYAEGVDSASVLAYVNALVDALKAVTQKPVFYCGWFGYADVVGMSRADGLSGSYYPAGNRSYRAHPDLQLRRIVASTLFRTGEDFRLRRCVPRDAPDSMSHKPRMIYEFDASDTPGAYMFPALAKLFRAEGVQVAAQFAYDCMALADRNTSWQTHYLNLVYTPEIAVSMAIAAEAMKRVPRGGRYVPATDELDFPPFYVNAVRNLSQLVADDAYFYTATPTVPPPAAGRLRRIYGCGASSVAASSGNGAYFLDKVHDGLWRLQLYPSIVQISDPYKNGRQVKRVVVGASPRFYLNLPDVGGAYHVHGTNGVAVATAEGGYVTLAPGDYLLSSCDMLSEVDLAASAELDVPQYVAPPAVSAQRVESLRHEAARLVGAPVRDLTSPSKWNFCEWIDMDLAQMQCDSGFARREERDGRRYLHVESAGFAEGQRRVLSAGIAASGADYAAEFPAAGPGRTLVVRVRATTDDTTRLQVVLVDADDVPWGATVPLSTEWRDVRIDMAKEMKYLSKWRIGEAPPPSARADIRRAESFRFLIGRWLFDEGTASRPHGFDVERVTVED